MSDAATASSVEKPLNQNGWDWFWFAPAPLSSVALIRGGLCCITALYFASCWADAAFWYTDGGPLAAGRVSTFLQTGGVEDAARWIISPLFLVDSIWIYRGYLVVGMMVAAAVALGRGGQFACWLLWALLVGWANRAMILSGLGETLLSLALFAAAIAPPRNSWSTNRADNAVTDRDWKAGFSQRLMSVQITVIGAATFVTMLGGRVWFNGLGAYVLAAPVENRTIDWTESWLARPIFHESLTHLMVIALPLGFLLAWVPRFNRLGQGILIGWCLLVALLGSHWLYAAVFAATVCAIQPRSRLSG